MTEWLLIFYATLYDFSIIKSAEVTYNETGRFASRVTSHQRYHTSIRCVVNAIISVIV